MTLSPRTGFVAIVIAVVTAVVIGGFVMAGSPTEARLRRLDDRRVSDLRGIQSAVDVYGTRHNKQLPASIDEAFKAAARSQTSVDPVTGAAYEYRAIDASSYELCAVFDRASQDAPVFAGDPFWSHSSGRQCFTLTMKDLSK